MKMLVIGAGVIGSVYAARLTAAGHDVSLLVRGSRAAELERDGLHLWVGDDPMHAQPHIVTAERPGSPADLIIVAAQLTQLDGALELLDTQDSAAVAFLQHLGPNVERVRSRVGAERTVLAFPGIGGFRRPNGSIEYLEIGAQPTTIDATAPRADVLNQAIRSTGMRTALEPDMPAWFATHSVFIACLGAGILARGGNPTQLAADRVLMRRVVQAIQEGFGALNVAGIKVTPTALRVLFLQMPRWFASLYWRRALRGPIGTVALAPHTRASRDGEFRVLCTTVLNEVATPATTPTLAELLAPWAQVPAE
ncbi:MAG: 2-dehydropantoate 2-reductase N-terminal domain-containing protein [Pseudolysinimonas sp.]